MKKSKYKVWGLMIILLMSYLPGASLLSAANPVHAAAVKMYAPTELRMAPASNMENTVVLVWEKPLVYSNIVNYEIYNSDGVLVGKTNKTYYKVLGLNPDTSYTFTVRALDASGNESLDSNAIKVTTKPAGVKFNVKDYGAAGDGKTMDTKAIQAALDACKPGGIVYFPAGTYLTGALFFHHSNITVYVDAGAQIKPSEHREDYLPFVAARHSYEEPQSYASLFNAGTMDRNNYDYSISDIAIIGPGTIGDEENGLALREEYDDFEKSSGVSHGGGSLISLNNAKNVYLDGLHIRNGMMWTIVPVYSKDITAYGLDINTTVHNGDGFDPNSSVNVYILSSNFQTGDDASAIKSGRDQEGRDIGRPSKFIYYRGDTFSGGHGGIVIGSEMSGGVSDVYAEDCILTPVDVQSGGINAGFKVKTSTTRGGYIRNIQIRDSLINRIDLNSNYDKLAVPGDYPPDMSNFRFINLRNSNMSSSGNVITLTGSASTPLSDNHVKNVQVTNCDFYQAQLTYTENIFFTGSSFKQPISATNSNNIIEDDEVLHDKSFPINEDFSGYKAGDLPGGYWTVQTGSSYIPGALKIADSKDSHENSLFYDDEGKGYVSAYRTFAAQTGIVTAQASFKLPAPPNLTNGEPDGTYASAATGSHHLFELIGSDGKMAMDFITKNDGSLVYNSKSDTQSTIVSKLPLDTWFTLKAVVDYPNKKVDVYYNGTKVLSDQPFYDTSSVPKDINTFKSITTNNNTTVAAQAYMDDLTITAPPIASKGYGINIAAADGAKSITEKGGSLKLTGSKVDSSGSVTTPQVKWTVYNPDLTPTDIAVIDNSGVLTAKKNGNVVVSASLNDGTEVASLQPVNISGQESITGIKKVKVTTGAHTKPDLPDTVKVTYDDGSVTPASVSWENISVPQYNQVGNFTIKGTVPEVDQKAVADITIAPVDVDSYHPVVIKTTPGVAPKLPAKVTAVYNNKKTKVLPVSWDLVDPKDYAQTNVKGFTVHGKVPGTDVLVTAQVAVLPEVVSGVAPILVAADGSGDFKSIQEAIDSVPVDNDHRVVIFIKNGVYYEKVLVPENKPYITFAGESEDGTVLTYDDHPNKTTPDGTSLGLGTYNDYTIMIKGHNFSAQNMTFVNSSGSGAGQSIAVDVNADKVSFDHCKILGYQDTLLTRNLTDNKDTDNWANNSTVQTYRSYYNHCYIAGSVDFIFGNAIAVFENSEIHSMLAGHVTAASTPEGQKYGYVFLNDKITSESLLGNVQDATGPVDLGRPWRPYSQAVFLNAYLGNHIATGGWNNWGKASNEATAFYAEYNSTGPGANPSARLPWTHQLTDEQAEEYTVSHIFKSSSLVGGKDDWDPKSLK